jgi:hypothetical protein
LVLAQIRRLTPLLLLALPMLMTALSLEFKRAQGPYWASGKVDPSYSYLLGSLAYAEGKPSMCCLHPGVTVQINGEWVLRASHAVIGQGALIADVLRDPEVYAAILGFEEILLYAAAILAAGWMIYRVTNRMELALMIQTPAFFNAGNFLWLNPIAPEALLYGVVILAGALAVVHEVDPGRRRLISIAFGVLTGVGLATKITYLPAAILPMIVLDSWVGLIVYLLAASVSFAALSVPHWETVDNALYFWNQLLHKQGLHGSGQEGHPHLADLAAIFGEYFRSDPFFTSMLLACFAATAWLLWARRATAPKRLLIGLTVCELLQIALASRQFSLRYLSPAYALLAAHAVILVYCLGPGVRRIATWASIAGVLVLVAARSSEVRASASELRASRHDSRKVVDGILAQRPGSTAIAYYGANTIPFALQFGNAWVYRAFAKPLEDLYPKTLFWDAYRRVFENFGSTVTIDSLGDCNNLLLEGTAFGVQPMGFSPPDHVSVEELGRFNGEAFYSMTCDVTAAPPPVQPAPAPPKSTNPAY